MHALIQSDTLTDNGQRHEFGADAPPDLSHKNPPLKWVPVVRQADPAFDPATEKLQRAADAITLTELTESREIIAMSAEEQAEYTRQQDIQIRETQAKSIYSALDAGTATGAQAQKVLAWMLKREFVDL